MPAGKRTLRSNRSDASANGEKARSNSQTSGSTKDKPAPAARSTRSKTSQKSSENRTTMHGDKSQVNGTEPIENGVRDSEDLEMGNDSLNGSKHGPDDEGEATSLPPAKVAKRSAERGRQLEDVTMGGTEEEDEVKGIEEDDLKAKALSTIKNNFHLLERGVNHFDPRFTLRVLRTISSMRKQLTPVLIAQSIVETFPISDSRVSFLLNAMGLGNAYDTMPNIMELDHGSKSPKSGIPQEFIPEIDTYLAILYQIYLYDRKEVKEGAGFSDSLVERLRTYNRRTLDPLAARVYYYYSLFYELVEPLPPSPSAAVISIRQPLLLALRTAVLRKDEDTQATITTLLLRNYLSTSHISQADQFVSHTQFPQDAPNNQIARYLYYLGRIRAIQLRYTEAHQHLMSATRKAPTTHSAAGFYQAANKLLVVVELLMGDIPDRALFREPTLEHALQPYFLLVKAVHVGDLDAFVKVVEEHGPTFRSDGIYTLILRLRQNVIKTGIRLMSLSYSRISLREICVRLGLGSEESAEYIVAKAIRDGVIEASIDHENGFMKSKDVGDVYATQEPGQVFHDRIQACLNLHDESVKAMRFPMHQHRIELKNAAEARDRERELAKEIAEGDMDDDDAGGDFDGI